MKKFMFSAVAIIAFVGSSMANDIALREVELEDSIQLFDANLDFIGPKEDFCYNVAADALDSFGTNVLMSATEANNFYQTAFKICMKNLN